MMFWVEVTENFELSMSERNHHGVYLPLLLYSRNIVLKNI